MLANMFPFHEKMHNLPFFFCGFYLEQRDLADDGVADVHGDVQTHFVWELRQQFLFI